MTASSMLTITTQEAAAISRKHLSFSTASATEKCPRRWAFEQLHRVPVDIWDPSETGTGVHTVLEEMFNLAPAERTIEWLDGAVGRLADLHVAVFLEHGDNPPIPSTVREDIVLPLHPDERDAWVAQVATSARGIWALEDPTEIDVHSCEHDVTGATIGWIPVSGLVDRIDWVTHPVTGQRGLRIVDYKSGKVPNSVFKRRDPLRQVTVYALAVAEMLGVEVLSAELRYVSFGVTIGAGTGRDNPAGFIVKDRAWESSCSDIARWLAAQWATHTESVAAAQFDAKPSPLCSWCACRADCPAGVLADAERQERLALTAVAAA